MKKEGHNCLLCKKSAIGRCFGNKNYGKGIVENENVCEEYEFGGSDERMEEILVNSENMHPESAKIVINAIRQNIEMRNIIGEVEKYQIEAKMLALKLAKEIVQRDSKAIANIILNMTFGNEHNVGFCEIFGLRDSGGCQKHARCTDCIDEYLTESYSKKVKKKLDEMDAMAEYILKNSHSCPIPTEIKCDFGFDKTGCKNCLMRNAHLLRRNKED